MKITFVGAGYVGLISSLVFASINKKHNFICYDIDYKKINKLKNGITPFFENGLEKLIYSVKNIDFTNDEKIAYNNADIIFICVATPQENNGSWDLSNLYKAVDSICKYNNKKIVIKSTVPIGTCEKIRKYIYEKYNKNYIVISNPEFLAQGTAVNDTKKPNRTIIGYDEGDRNEILDLLEIYKKFDNVLIMSTKSSEMSKVAANNFLALKLSFFNEISNICRMNDISVNDVVQSMKFDDRIGNKYMEPGIGYGGSCLPKDSKSLYNWSKENGYEPLLIKAGIDLNDRQRILMSNIIVDMKIKKNTNIGIMGLTFKSNTDDIRDSSSIETIKSLLKKGYKNISCYDPKGIENTKKVLNDNVRYLTSVKEMISKNDILLIMNDWKIFNTINNFKNKNLTIINSSNKIKINSKNFKKCIQINK